ncbi:PDGLE domain-containing protein [Nocardioides luteus]|uniref:Cobalt ABC transporter permease n=1 Tax=Nocardioides luteus TaxID=1844 RepID=A0A1J4MZE6_9ACTN|nr:PDGLE domain-containing protein [Nocardioides luteus]OIJ24055.1 cobalt ABC transporter permease [Nocardioides luteus]
MSTTTKKRVPFRWVALGIAVVALLLAGVVSYYASANPDGLEYVAGKTGFLDRASEHGAADGPLAGYGTKGVDDARLSGGLAGVIGTVVVLVVAGGLVLLVRRRPTDSSDEA